MVHISLHSQQRVNNSSAGFGAVVRVPTGFIKLIMAAGVMELSPPFAPPLVLEKRFVTDLAGVLLKRTVAVSHTGAATVWILSAACQQPIDKRPLPPSIAAHLLNSVCDVLKVHGG